MKVLMTYIESGMGHISSIKSISDNFKKYFGDKCEIVDSYIMQESNNKDLINFEKYLTRQVKRVSQLKGYGTAMFDLFEVMGKAKFMRFVHKTLFRKATLAAIGALSEQKPDVIVSTHYFISFVALEYKNKIDPDCKVVTYNPDNDVMSLWDNRSEQLFLVNNRRAYEQCLSKKRSFNQERVKLVDFLARGALVDCNSDQMSMRDELGINRNKPCVLVADGVYACANCEKIVKEILKRDLPITAIMLAGKNKELYDKYANKQFFGKTTLIPLAFTPEIYKYYKASDVFVTKAGPNAILDSVFMGTPVLIDYYATPTEKATTRLFVDEFKVGIECKKPKKIVDMLEDWLKEPNHLKEMRENTKVFDKNNKSGYLCAKYIYEECISSQN